MGIGIVVLFWLVVAIIIVAPIVLVRLRRLYKSGNKTKGQKRRGAFLNVASGGVVILLVGLWIPIKITIIESTDTPESRFEMIFGKKPSQDLRIIESDSEYSSDFTSASVRFQMPIEELQRMMPPTLVPFDPQGIPGHLDFRFARDCLGQQAFLEEPWRRSVRAYSYVAVTFCPETQIVFAVASDVD